MQLEERQFRLDYILLNEKVGEHFLDLRKTFS